MVKISDSRVVRISNIYDFKVCGSEISDTPSGQNRFSNTPSGQKSEKPEGPSSQKFLTPRVVRIVFLTPRVVEKPEGPSGQKFLTPRVVTIVFLTPRVVKNLKNRGSEWSEISDHSVC